MYNKATALGYVFLQLLRTSMQTFSKGEEYCYRLGPRDIRLRTQRTLRTHVRHLRTSS
jgi:hypothetical protein